MLTNISKAKSRGVAKTTLERLKVGQAASGHWDYWAAEFRSVPRAITDSEQWGIFVGSVLGPVEGM